MKSVQKYKTVNQMLEFLKEEISDFYQKDDVVLQSDLSSSNCLYIWLQFKEFDHVSRVKILQLIHKACYFDGCKTTKYQLVQKLVTLKSNLVAFILVTLADVRVNHVNCNYMSILSVTFDIIHCIFQCLPTSSLDFIDIVVPQLKSSLSGISGEVKDKLLSEINELVEQRKDFFSQDPSNQNCKGDEKVPPPCDFRDIAVLPDKEELINVVKPYLRRNVVIGPYKNADHYLDIHFRLMREDMFCYLKECMMEYHSGNWPSRVSALLKYGHVYFDVSVLGMEYSNGIFFTAEVYIGKKVDWNTTKRLKSNSLLCVSHDKFESFAFVCVHSCEPNKNTSCYLKFSVESVGGLDYIHANRLYDIIETTAFYESYKHVLKRLQQLNVENFPLSSCLLHFAECNKRPAYWKKKPVKNAAFKVLGNSEKLKLQEEKIAFNAMLNEKEKYFDKHQQIAFQMALSNTVSLIQGPPGTGKTFLGLQIVQWLLKNASVHMGAPILIVCYTNHALDQFLEGVLRFTQKVVRIGGQSKNACMESYNLNNLVAAKLGKGNDRSLKVANDIFGHHQELQRLGPYVRAVKGAEQMLVRCQLLIFEIDNNPIYSEKVAPLLWPTHFTQEVLWYLNIFVMKTSEVHEFLIVGIHYWLCISVLFVYVYEEYSDFLFCVVKELVDYVEGTPVKVKRRATTASEELDMPQDNVFFLELWNAFQKCKNPDDQNADKAYFYKNDVKARVKAFLRANALDSRITFRLLESAAQKCLANQVTPEMDECNIWSCGLLDRWALFFLWKSRAEDKLKAELREMQENYEEVLQNRDDVKFSNNVKLVKCADVFGLTTTGAAKHWNLLQKVGPCVVVVEEAAEVLESHIVTSLTENTKHLILIGDHKQLRPNPTVYDLARKYKLDISMFERLLTNGVPSHCLQMQHRMRPCIAELLVPEIYENLENHPSVLKFENIKGMAENVYFVTHQELEVSNGDLRSHSNKHEAHFLVCLCSYLLQQGYAASSITMLTVYVGQLKLLKDLMKQRGMDAVRVTTVDNFQGEENDIILLSFVRSNKRDVIGFLEMSNRVCVALSRAKCGLYCIGNFELFYEKCSVWRSIIKKLKKKHMISSSLPLKCQKHPQKVTLVSNEHEYKNVMDGGCFRKCTEHLACGHICPLYCHPDVRSHQDIPCTRGGKNCQKKCPSSDPGSFPSKESKVPSLNESPPLKCKKASCSGKESDISEKLNSAKNKNSVPCETENVYAKESIPTEESKLSSANDSSSVKCKQSDLNQASAGRNFGTKETLNFAKSKSVPCEIEKTNIEESIPTKELSFPSSSGKNSGTKEKLNSVKSKESEPCKTEKVDIARQYMNTRDLDLLTENVPSMPPNCMDILKDSTNELFSRKHLNYSSEVQEKCGVDFFDNTCIQKSTLGMENVCDQTSDRLHYSVSGDLDSKTSATDTFEELDYQSSCELDFDEKRFQCIETLSPVGGVADGLSIVKTGSGTKPTLWLVTSSLGYASNSSKNPSEKDGHLETLLETEINCSSSFEEINFEDKHEEDKSCSFVRQSSLSQYEDKDCIIKMSAKNNGSSSDLVATGKNLMESVTIDLTTNNPLEPVSSGYKSLIVLHTDTLQCSSNTDFSNFQEGNGPCDDFEDTSCIPGTSDLLCNVLKSSDQDVIIVTATENDNICNSSLGFMGSKPKENLTIDLSSKDPQCATCSIPESTASVIAANAQQYLNDKGMHTFNCSELSGNISANLNILKPSCNAPKDKAYCSSVQKEYTNTASTQICDHSVRKTIDCRTLVMKTLHCGHKMPVPCNETDFQYICQVQVEVKLLCGHAQLVPCCERVPSTDKQCTHQVTQLMPCGEKVQFVCFEGLQHKNCTSLILDCGHGVPCNTQADLYTCKILVKHVLPCSHDVFIPCCKYNPLETVLCKELILIKPPCGHETQVACPSRKYGELDMQRLCKSKCTFTLPCGHKCRSTVCGHCFMRNKHALCAVLVEKVLPCGHQGKFRCHIEDPVCLNQICDTTLSCGHRCSGQCGQCFKFNIHAMCLVVVERILPCGHSIRWPCGAPPPLCEMRCLFRCDHHRCLNSCQHPCIKCTKPCEWKCEHQSCTLLCSEVCDRSPCDAHCPKILPCGHECAGFCGEPCPKLCLICDDNSNGRKGHSRYVLLEDCQHSLTAEELDQYFEKKSNYCCPSCPVCGTVITKNRRFGRHIKIWLKSYLHSYEFENNENSVPDYEPGIFFKRRKLTFPDVVQTRKTSSIFTKYAAQIIENKVGPSYFSTAIKMFNNYCILVHIKACVGKFKLESHGLLSTFDALSFWLTNHCSSCSVQQVEESCLTVRRLSVLCLVKCVSGRCCQSEIVKITSLLESKKYGSCEDGRLVKLLGDIQVRAKVHCENKSCFISTITDFISDLRVFQESTVLISFNLRRYFCDSLSL